MFRTTFSTTSNLFVGARPGTQGVEYRVWAPDHRLVEVCIQSVDGTKREIALHAEENGYFAGIDSAGRAGDRYRYRLNHETFPDPASRFQPQGVHGPSECIDPSAYEWKVNWDRPGWRGQSIYELHVGTFTADGSFRSAMDRLDHLAELGVGVIEVMPIADFAGDRNWGYDGVAPYAPARCYGRPDDFRAFIDAAHQRGLAVVLDVVYNHFGPAGNYLARFAKDYFHASRETPWGSAINFDGANSRPVRDYFLGNVVYWLDEYRLDGLRLDATHAIEDQSELHLLAEISELAHARGAFLIAEDERNSCRLITPTDRNGYGIDAAWSDDFHHHVRVALTGTQHGYFASYDGSIDSLASTLDTGWFYTGQEFPTWSGRSRGELCRDVPPQGFVYCIENHDQIGNRALGERLEHVIAPELFRAASVLLCLSPYPPLIFMGQEWSASSPFLYFTQHDGELGRAISQGRRKEFADLFKQVPEEQVPDPQSLGTFLKSKLEWAEINEGIHRQTFALYRECLLARRSLVGPVANDRDRWNVSATASTLLVRYELLDGRAAILVVAFEPGSISRGTENRAFHLGDGARWRVALQTESPKFGGAGRITGSLLSSEHVGTPWIDFLVPGAVLLVEEKL